MKTKLILITGLVIVAFGAGYLLSLNKGDSTDKITTTTENNINQSTEDLPKNATLSEIVSYSLPDRWEENSCVGSEASFLTPNGTSINCDAKPVSPIKLSKDSGNTTDCNELQNQLEVKKHTCISLFINGTKTLKSSTEFLKSGEYGKAMVVDAYYFDSGSGIVKAEYIHTPEENEYQADFDELVNSLTAKNS